MIFRFARQAGMIPLTGSTDPARMAADLSIDELPLDDEEIRTIETTGLRGD